MSDWNWGSIIVLVAVVAGYFITPFITSKLEKRRKLRTGKQANQEVDNPTEPDKSAAELDSRNQTTSSTDNKKA